MQSANNNKRNKKSTNRGASRKYDVLYTKFLREGSLEFQFVVIDVCK